MKGQLSMFDQKTCEVLDNATSSPELPSGPTHSGKLDGRIAARSGPDQPPASPSAPQAKAMSSQMSATYGRHGSGSSESAALSLSLANRLQAKTRYLGSTMFQLTWKQRVTPSGRSIPALRASARRTSDKGSTSWATPRSTDAKCGSMYTENCEGKDLAKDANLASWPSPTTPSGGQTVPEGTTAEGMTPDGRKVQVTLKDVAQLASWPTPQAIAPAKDGYSESSSSDYTRQIDVIMGLRETKNGPLLAPWPTPRTPPGGAERKQELGRMESGGGDLQAVAQLATWATPRAEDSESSGMRHSRGVADTLTAQSSMASPWVSPQAADANGAGANQNTARLDNQVRLTDSGPTPNGSPAATEKRGQLNPALSRWLQGLPPEWCDCAVTAMQSMPSRRGTSSKPTGK